MLHILGIICNQYIAGCFVVLISSSQMLDEARAAAAAKKARKGKRVKSKKSKTDDKKDAKGGKEKKKAKKTPVVGGSATGSGSSRRVHGYNKAGTDHAMDCQRDLVVWWPLCSKKPGPASWQTWTTASVNKRSGICTPQHGLPLACTVAMVDHHTLVKQH
jgi:hypothetical protein